MAFKFRRGLEVDRLQLSGGTYDIPPDGEPLWVTNTDKLYVGNGVTHGGVLIGPITDFSELSNTAHTHAYSAITDTAHTHSQYVSQYSSPIFDRITATSIVTTGSSIRTTSLTANTATANTLFSKEVIISGDGGLSRLSFKGTGSDINITCVHAVPATLYVPNLSLTSNITGTSAVFTTITGTSVSATNYYCGSTNLSSLIGVGGVSDHGALTGLYDNDHPQYRLTSATILASSVTHSSTSASKTFGGTAEYYFPAQICAKGQEIYVDVDGIYDESSYQFRGGAAYVIYKHSTNELRWLKSGNGTLNLKLWGDIYLGNGKVFLSNTIYNPQTNYDGSGIWFGSATTSNNLTYRSTPAALSSSTHFIVNGNISATTYYSGNNLLQNVLSPTGHTHLPSEISDGSFTNNHSFAEAVSFGKSITGKSGYFDTIVSGNQIISTRSSSGGSMLSLLRSGTTDVLIRMGTNGAEIHSLTLDQSVGGGLSNFILSTGITIDGPISTNTSISAGTYSGIVASVIRGSDSSSNPEYFSSVESGKTYFGFGNHLSIDNSLSNTATTSTAIYFKTTGNTKVGFELNKDTGEFSFFSPSSPVSNWKFSTGNVKINGSLSAVTYSGLPITKSITVPDPRSTENITMFYLDKSALFTKVVGVVSGSSPSVTWLIGSASTRTGATGTITGATTTSQDGVVYDITPNLIVPANTWVIFKVTATGGTSNNEVHITTYYKEQ